MVVLYLVSGKPSPPSLVRVTEQYKTDIKLIFSLGRDNGSPIKRIHIEAITNFDPEWAVIKTLTIKDGEQRNTIYELLKLSPWASYKFRVVAENDIGSSRPSEPTTTWTTTPSTRPEKSPGNIKGVGTATDKIKITFEVCDARMHLSPVRFLKIRKTFFKNLGYWRRLYESRLDRRHGFYPTCKK